MLKEYITKVNEDGVNYLCAVRECPTETLLTQPEYCVRLINEIFDAEHLAEEHVYMIAADANCKPIGVFDVTHGCATASMCNSRELLIRALLSGATMVILLHNHPSGDTQPSAKDVQTTNTCVEAFRLIGISMEDHIIIGRDRYMSFNEQNMM